MADMDGAGNGDELKPGDRVQIIAGSFAAYVGVIERIDVGNRDAWVSVVFFGRRMSVQVGFSEVKKLPPPC